MAAPPSVMRSHTSTTPASRLAARLRSDKKTVQGKVHFVLPVKIGDVAIVSGVDERQVLESIEAAL